MTRRVVALAVGALALGGAVAAVVAGLRAGGDPSLPAPAGEAVVLTATVTPARHLFGDSVTAELTLTVDEALVTPESIRFSPRFGPYRQRGRAETTRRDLGSTTVITYRYTLQCIDRACAPGGDEKELELPFSVLRYAHRELLGVIESVTWPPITVVSRFEPGDLEDPRLEVAPGDIAPAGFRADPSVLGWLLVGLAAALLLAVAAFAARKLWRSAPLPAVAPEAPAGPPLLVTLELIEAALEAGEEERRTALDELARVLEGAGHADLARLVRRLAWSKRSPVAEEMREVATAARSVLGEVA
jgi:hypothetical protein